MPSLFDIGKSGLQAYRQSEKTALPASGYAASGPPYALDRSLRLQQSFVQGRALQYR